MFDVYRVHPVKGNFFKKGSLTKKQYYIYIRYEHISCCGGKKLELVSRIPDKHSACINDYLLKRMEYVGNLKNDSSLWKLLFNQNL